MKLEQPVWRGADWLLSCCICLMKYEGGNEWHRATRPVAMVTRPIKQSKNIENETAATLVVVVTRLGSSLDHLSWYYSVSAAEWRDGPFKKIVTVSLQIRGCYFLSPYHLVYVRATFAVETVFLNNLRINSERRHYMSGASVALTS
jgi:hypothetical protein